MTKRTFLAIKINPKEEMLRRIQYLKTNLAEENISWIRQDHLHITLRFIGATAEKEVVRIEDELQKVVVNFEKTEINLSGLFLFGSTHSPKLIWFGVEPGKIITDLAAEIDQVLSPLGFERDRQNFIPHLSIGRIRKLRNKEFFHRVIESADQNLIQTERIEKIIFYESILKNSGAEYAVLKEFSLLD